MADIHRDERGRFAPGDSMGNQPVTEHANTPSVHTRLSAAARDAIIRGKGVDQRHYPVRTDAEVTAKTDFGKPQGSQMSTAGRFKYQPPKKH